MDISVIVPLYNEAESLPELEAWIARVMADHGFSYEILFINDGSTDDSWEVIRSLAEKNPAVKGVSFRRNYGKSPALNTGFVRAQGDVVITMDADLQDSPDEIPALYDMIKREGYDLVSGWKQKRYDPLSKTIPTKLFNATARRIGTFDTSILPYEDCCTVFTPRHPCTHPKLRKVREAEAGLDVDALVAEAVAGIEFIKVGY